MPHQIILRGDGAQDITTSKRKRGSVRQKHLVKFAGEDHDGSSSPKQVNDKGYVSGLSIDQQEGTAWLFHGGEFNKPEASSELAINLAIS